METTDTTDSTCGCCAGIEQITPEPTTNRPGLDALTYRIGTHASFLETMKARLSEMAVDDLIPLQGLTTREADDPAIALLDSWAVVGDVLTFYQERIANEGYLRSALERRSVLNLARLVGYKLRPGVAATVYLAYTIDDKHKQPVEIPIGARAQSVPVAGELPQMFETVEKLDARAAWNSLKLRMQRPQTAASITGVSDGPQIYLKGIATNLKPNDPVLIDFGDGVPQFTRVQAVLPDLPADRTRVTLRAWPGLQDASTAPATEQTEAELQREAVRKQLAELRAITERFLTSEAERHGVSVRSDMYKRVASKLRILGASREISEVEYLSRLDNDVLPSMQQEEKVAGDSTRYTKLKPWMSDLVGELQALSQRGRTARAERLARSFALAATAPPVVVKDKSSTPPAVNVFRKGDDVLTTTMRGLTKPGTVSPANDKLLNRRGVRAFQPQADAGVQIAAAFDERLGESLPVAVANAKAAQDNAIKFYALRATARLFGHNAPPRTALVDVVEADESVSKVVRFEEWNIRDPFNGGATTSAVPYDDSVIALDAEYALTPSSWVVFEKGQDALPPFQMSENFRKISQESVTGYSLSGKSTRLHFEDSSDLLEFTGINTVGDAEKPQALDQVRAATVHLQSEELALAEEPIAKDICGGNNDLIELDGLYNDLKSGRWLIVSGERADITSTSTANGERVPGVRSSELVMLAEVVHTVEETTLGGGRAGGSYYPSAIALPGDRTHTYIRLATKLEYCYARDTVTIYGNVVKATHGETRNESLGNGDGSKAMQTFALKQKPLTHVPAPTPAGAQSTLSVFVSDVEWHEADGLAGLGPTDRTFITHTDDDDKTSVIFGNGKAGARPPTGLDNIKAKYRNGIGKVGNVKAGQISLLMSRPLGVKEVINPLRASGGAERETRDQARRNVPLAVMALDRLVSVQDYEDFARVFAGIGKASAQLLSDGRQELVHVTIAGADDIPIEPSSDLYRNLVRALRQFGEPQQALQVAVRELALLVISARIKPHPDYVWEPLVAKVRARLLDAFSFDRRELGQDAMLSEVVAVVQAVPGVVFVDVDVFGSVAEKTPDGSRPRTPQELSAEVKTLFDEHVAGQSLRTADKKQPRQRVSVNKAEGKGATLRPAQLAFLSPAVPDTLILNQI